MSGGATAMVGRLGLDDRYSDEGLLLRPASVLFLAYTAHKKIRCEENLGLSDAKGPSLGACAY